MARRKPTVSQVLDLKHYSRLFAKGVVLPEATIDVEVRLEAVGDGELSAAWFEHRRAEEMRTPLVCVPASDAGHEGVAVLQNPEMAGMFAQSVQYHGLPRTIQTWVGLADYTQSGDMMIAVMRDGGAVHEEIIPEEFARARKAELAKFFRGDKLVVSSVVEGFLARAGRYSEQDRTRFLHELQMLQQLCDMNCLSLVGANMHAGRIG